MNGFSIRIDYNWNLYDSSFEWGGLYDAITALGGTAEYSNNNYNRIEITAILPQGALTAEGALASLSFRVNPGISESVDLPVRLTVREFFSMPADGEYQPIRHRDTDGCVHVSVDVIEGVLGDVTDDGEVTVVDALLILRYVIGLTNLTSEQRALADVNHDGAVNTVDALLVMRFVIGLIDGFPTRGLDGPRTERVFE